MLCNSTSVTRQEIHDHCVLTSDRYGLLASVNTSDRQSATERLAAASSMFAWHARPDALPVHDVGVIAELLLVMLYLDDYFELAGLRDGELRDSTPVGRLLADWTVAFGRRCPSTGIESEFLASLHRYLKSLCDETSVKSGRGHITESDYWELRRNTAAAEPYALCLEALLNIRVPTRARDSLLSCTVDICAVVNDLGSISRDRAELTPNLVTCIMWDRGLPLDEATSLAVWYHDSVAAEFRLTADYLRRVLPDSPDVDRYIVMLESVVDGNLRTTLELSARYGQPSKQLQSLPSVREDTEL